MLGHCHVKTDLSSCTDLKTLKIMFRPHVERFQSGLGHAVEYAAASHRDNDAAVNLTSTLTVLRGGQ